MTLGSLSSLHRAPGGTYLCVVWLVGFVSEMHAKAGHPVENTWSSATEGSAGPLAPGERQRQCYWSPRPQCQEQHWIPISETAQMYLAAGWMVTNTTCKQKVSSADEQNCFKPGGQTTGTSGCPFPWLQRRLEPYILFCIPHRDFLKRGPPRRK